MTTDTELIRTDPEQPPVAVRQRTPLTATAGRLGIRVKTAVNTSANTC